MSRTLRSLTLLGPVLALLGCPDPLQDQDSLQAHERPLLSVPAGVVPTRNEVGLRTDARPEPARSLAEAASLSNPIKATRTNVELGKVAYSRYCSHCHGDLGYGWTSIGSSFDPRPPDLVQIIDGRSDGELFGVITFGGRISPPLGATVAIDDRWRIIGYLRTLRQERERSPLPRPHWDQNILQE